LWLSGLGNAAFTDGKIADLVTIMVRYNAVESIEHPRPVKRFVGEKGDPYRKHPDAKYCIVP